MAKETLNRVNIKVETFFRDDLSDAQNDSYVYNYKITIENKGTNRVQLLKRYWKIEHLGQGTSLVSGDGVIGQQPILIHNESFTYVSGCQMQAPIGRMSGFYTFQDVETEEVFAVKIPPFKLVFPPMLN